MQGALGGSGTESEPNSYLASCTFFARSACKPALANPGSNGPPWSAPLSNQTQHPLKGTDKDHGQRLLTEGQSRLQMTGGANLLKRKKPSWLQSQPRSKPRRRGNPRRAPSQGVPKKRSKIHAQALAPLSQKQSKEQAKARKEARRVPTQAAPKNHCAQSSQVFFERAQPSPSQGTVKNILRQRRIQGASHLLLKTTQGAPRSKARGKQSKAQSLLDGQGAVKRPF